MGNLAQRGVLSDFMSPSLVIWHHVERYLLFARSMAKQYKLYSCRTSETA